MTWALVWRLVRANSGPLLLAAGFLLFSFAIWRAGKQRDVALAERDAARAEVAVSRAALDRQSASIDALGKATARLAIDINAIAAARSADYSVVSDAAADLSASARALAVRPPAAAAEAVARAARTLADVEALNEAWLPARP